MRDTAHGEHRPDIRIEPRFTPAGTASGDEGASALELLDAARDTGRVPLELGDAAGDSPARLVLAPRRSIPLPTPFAQQRGARGIAAHRLQRGRHWSAPFDARSPR